MKKLFAACILLALIAVPGIGSGTSAHAELYRSDPVDAIFSRYRPTYKSVQNDGIKGEARYWSDQTTYLPSYLLRIAKEGGKGNTLCLSINDPECSIVPGSYLDFSSVLGLCESVNELSCIEGVSLSTRSTPLESLKLVSGGETLHSEVRTSGIPRGTTMSIWEASDGSRYAVNPVIKGLLNQGNNQWAPSSSLKFAVDIIRVPSIYVAAKPVVLYNEGIGVWGLTTANYYWPRALEPLPESRFELKLRLPSSMSSWFQGRIKNANVGATPIDAERILYTFAGQPGKVHVAGAFAATESLNFPVKRDPWNTNGFSVRVGRASEIQDYKIWKPFIDDISLISREEWSVRAYENFSVNGKSCLEGSKGAVGIAATNAAFYSPTPPVINPTTGMFEYVVASPHFDETRQVAVGSYSFGLPLTVLQCFTGSTVEPSAARVSLVYDSGTSPYTVIQDVTVQDGWVNVSINGFHFSKPKLKVGFLWRDAKGRLVALPSAVKKGSVKSGSRFATSVLSSPASRLKPKWSASGACKIKSGTVITTKRGKCVVTLKVRNRSGRYVTQLTKSIKVV